jgi:hypothetical protein
MSKLTELKTELEALKTVLAALINGGEDSLDSNAGESTFTDQARIAQGVALNNLRLQQTWLLFTLAQIDAGILNEYDTIKRYDVDPEITSELAIKQAQIIQFQSLFNAKLNIGADAISIVEV